MESVDSKISDVEKMFDLSSGGIFLLILFLRYCVTFYFALVIESGKLSLGLEEMRTSEKKHTESPATWKDGAMAVGVDLEKYERHMNAFIERYHIPMDNLTRMEWLTTEMDEDEKNRMRMEF